MNNKLLLAVATAAGITAGVTTSLATPLPDGTLLKITPTTDPGFAGPVPGCANGSCFGMYLFPGLFYWTPIFPGTDGGVVIGKGQKSGGQEVNSLSSNDGELSAAWFFGANWGTFFTAPSDAGNVFDDASCTGSGCGSNTTPIKTALNVWNTAWNQLVIPMGSAAGCNKMLLPNCTADQEAGIFVKTWDIDPAGTSPRKYRLTYNQVVPTLLPNFPFELVLSGTIDGLVNLPPVANDVLLKGEAGVALTWTPVVSDSDGPNPLTCFIGTPPANGTVTVASDCSIGSYTSELGFRGIDSFTYGANDGLANSNLATVTVGIVDPQSTACTQTYPVKQYTYDFKSKLTMVVTGNIGKSTNKEVRICPTTRLDYNATSAFYPVTCYINNIVAATKGSVTVGSQLKCNVKPYAGDQYNIRIKSAI
jgi:hypothetical protein